MRKLLLPFSLVYWLGVSIRNWFFDIGILKSTTVHVPVISVGNISAGGVGKTPFVELLLNKEILPCPVSVVSRGYGRNSSGTVVASDGHGSCSSADLSGDEAAQIARKHPKLIVVVDEDRVRGAEKAVELGAQTILLDDGFQHRYLHRDLDIVLLTVEEIMSRDFLLPAGNRREPLISLKRAHVIAVTRCANVDEYQRARAAALERHSFPGGIPIVGVKTNLKIFRRAFSNEMVDAALFAGKNIIVFSGIGNPKSLDELLLAAHGKILRHIVFSDHHWYRENDIERIIDAKKQTHAGYIVTTEKDAARLREEFPKFLETEPVIVAEIQQEVISGDDVLNEAVKRTGKTIKG